jgi:hypothetical protein
MLYVFSSYASIFGNPSIAAHPASRRLCHQRDVLHKPYARHCATTPPSHHSISYPYPEAQRRIKSGIPGVIRTANAYPDFRSVSGDVCDDNVLLKQCTWVVVITPRAVITPLGVAPYPGGGEINDSDTPLALSPFRPAPARASH